MFYTIHLTILNLIIFCKISLQWTCLPAFSYPTLQFQLERPSTDNLKLKHLNDKRIRYEQHKNFLNGCVSEVLIPEGLKLESRICWYLVFTPQELLPYPNEKHCNLLLYCYCNKTIAQKMTPLTETDLKNVTDKEELKLP